MLNVLFVLDKKNLLVYLQNRKGEESRHYTELCLSVNHLWNPQEFIILVSKTQHIKQIKGNLPTSEPEKAKT